MTKPQTPRLRPRTEFRVPPPLIQRTDAKGFTGADLLDEELGRAALLFWQAYRDVELWGRTADRRGLFDLGDVEVRASEIAGLEPPYSEVAGTLNALLDVVRNPEAAEPAQVADLCSSLAAWFEAQGRLRCAVDFALAAFFADSVRASLAVRVARLTRMLAEYPRSTSWFDYSLYLARRGADWQAYSEALAGLGNLYFQIGNLPRARHFHRRCLRLANRQNLPEMQGAAYHNLFNVEMDAGSVDLAQELAAKALAAYPPESWCMVRLARDLSRRWTVLGQFERALPLAVATLEHFSAPVDRALVWADIARSAGGCGELTRFEEAWIEAWTLVRRGIDPVTSDVLIDLAHGAASTGDFRRAAYAAERALAVARDRKEGRTILEAEALIESLQQARAATQSEAPQGGGDGEAPGGAPELVDQMLMALRRVGATAA